MTNVLLATLWGVNSGFWIGMACCLAVVIVMNAVYWNFPDKSKKQDKDKKDEKDKN